MLYSFRAFRVFRILSGSYFYSEKNYAVKLLELCRQTIRKMSSNYLRL